MYLVFYYTLLSDWVALLYPSLALLVDAIGFSLFSERKKPSKEKEKEDSQAHYRRARPLAFNEVNYFVHEFSIKKMIVPTKIMRAIR